MHPAYSVIFFTTATGAGYGLIALFGILGGSGVIAPDFRFGAVGVGLALALIAGGLSSSTAHLGNRARAWRAFSQWRSSWLSREGVLAVATFVPAGLFAVGWVLLGRSGGWVAAAGLLTAVGAAATVCCTAMIYASLKPIAQWHSRFTVPVYLVLALASGLTLLDALLALFGRFASGAAIAAVAFCFVGAAVKLATWRRDDAVALPTTVNAATGLAGGTVRSLEWPHTEENFILKEMGFRVARKHRQRLRIVAQVLGFLVPALLLGSGLAVGRPLVAALAVLAVISQAAGLLVERWLFFAEAKHTVMLYYGRA